LPADSFLWAHKCRPPNASRSLGAHVPCFQPELKTLSRDRSSFLSSPALFFCRALPWWARLRWHSNSFVRAHLCRAPNASRSLGAHVPCFQPELKTLSRDLSSFLSSAALYVCRALTWWARLRWHSDSFLWVHLCRAPNAIRSLGAHLTCSQCELLLGRPSALCFQPELWRASNTSCGVLPMRAAPCASNTSCGVLPMRAAPCASNPSCGVLPMRAAPRASNASCGVLPTRACGVLPMRAASWAPICLVLPTRAVACFQPELWRAPNASCSLGAHLTCASNPSCKR
jgi:hypothetical protein